MVVTTTRINPITLVFVDTTNLLSLYGLAEKTTAETVDKLLERPEQLICSSQVKMEFFKNRQVYLRKLLDHISDEKKYKLSSAPIVRSYRAFREIEALEGRLKQAQDKLIKAIEGSIKNRRSDPILKRVDKFFETARFFLHEARPEYPDIFISAEAKI